MIIVKNRELLIPNNERYIGTTYDNDTENRVFQVPRFSQRGVDLANLTFRLDIQYANESYDTVVLDKEVGEAFIILIWRITSATLQVPGTLYIGLRAIDDEATVKWSSFSAAMYAERHLNTPGNYGGSLTEIEQIEQDHQYMKNVINELKDNLDYAHDAEAWAQGTRSGTAVPSTDKTYHKNSKYYADQANTKATAAANSATAAANSATQAAATVADTNTRFNNAVAAVTVNTEVQDARVGADGTTYSVLKDRLDAEHTQVKSALNKWFYESFAFTDSEYTMHITDIRMVLGETIIVSTIEPSVCRVSIEGGQALSVNDVGTYVYTADATGLLRIYCRSFTGNIYYSVFSVKSERGTSEVFAASQKLVESAFSAIAETNANVTEMSADLSNKYDRYAVRDKSGISLSNFEICPSQYTIVQYDNTDAVQHGAITGYIFSKLVRGVSDVTCRIHQVEPKALIALAVTESKAIGFNLNGTSGNVSLLTASGYTVLKGIFRNSECPTVVVGDTLHIKKDGTKIAIYLISNGVDVPVFADEWVDILATYETSAGITETDVGIGFVTNNSSRNEPIAYDFTMIIESGDHFMPYDEVDARLTALEDGSGFNPSRVDLFMFMGQSNMAGRGTASQAPEVIAEAGYEFRAISDPTKLYPITEPFGLDENVEGKIYDYLGGYKAKSGDMVPAFVNAYFEHTHVSIVGVSASEGGTRISLWQPGTDRYTDALARFTAAVTWLEQNGYTIRHKYMLWCQGESNGDDGMSKADYISAFTTMANAWFTNGIEKIFLIKIGNYNGTGSQDYNTIMAAQNEICQTMDNVVMASTDFAGMKDRGLMRDDFHYQQAAYNEVGTYAGINTALYVNTGKEPTMYDTQDGSLYFSHKN